MAKIKHITWKSIVVQRYELDNKLNEWNFQPGKFIVSHIPFSNNVMVTFVVREV